MDWNVLKSPRGIRRARMGALEMEFGARHMTKAHPQPLGHQHPDTDSLWAGAVWVDSLRLPVAHLPDTLSKDTKERLWVSDSDHVLLQGAPNLAPGTPLWVKLELFILFNWAAEPKTQLLAGKLASLQSPQFRFSWPERKNASIWVERILLHDAVTSSTWRALPWAEDSWEHPLLGLGSGMGLGQTLKGKPHLSHVFCARTCTDPHKSEEGVSELSGGVRGRLSCFRRTEREMGLTYTHWQVFFFFSIPKGWNLSSLKIDLAYRCVLFGPQNGLKSFEFVANF